MHYYGTVMEYYETINSPERAKKVYKELLFIRLRERIPELKNFCPDYVSFIEKKDPFYYGLFLRVLEASFPMFMRQKRDKITNGNSLTYSDFRNIVQFWFNNSSVVDMYKILLKNNKLVNKFKSFKL
jgi:hypothetical protein